ncbi:DUF1904 family protein [Metabacillus herbersteinensis]|uniref:DUF1904 family protein n=1 Tax=Metabacillus herbersteinensis TaxID=283816 RepID=A0ABV6GDM3_9BACI
MPHLMIRGISVEQVKEISTPLVQELARLCKCETDTFTLEIVNSTFILDQNEVPGYPFIEVKWFERGQAIQDHFTQLVTKHVLSLGIPEVEVAFTAFLESAYYYNGKSFAKN